MHGVSRDLALRRMPQAYSPAGDSPNHRGDVVGINGRSDREQGVLSLHKLQSQGLDVHDHADWRKNGGLDTKMPLVSDQSAEGHQGGSKGGDDVGFQINLAPAPAIHAS